MNAIHRRSSLRLLLPLAVALLAMTALTRCGPKSSDDGVVHDVEREDDVDRDTSVDFGDLAGCGNGELESNEECDQPHFRGETCLTLGFAGGELRCDGLCRIDTLYCSGAPVCGDGVAGGDEECDGGDLNEATCESMGFDGGMLFCNGCRFATDECYREPECGDGQKAGEEECDGADFGDTTCDDFEGPFGRLACTEACVIDHSRCAATAYCGDGTVSDGEECDDGNVLNGDGCDEECFEEFCGDGIIQSELGEQCDQGNVIVFGCEDYPGRTFGIGYCGAACAYDVFCSDVFTCGNGSPDLGEACDDGNTENGDGCSSTCDSERCGNGVLDPGEACDASCSGASCSGGSGFGSRGCADFGLDLGMAECTAGCWVDPTDCSHSICGDGAVEGDEECDDGNLDPGDGCGADCAVEEACDEGERIPVWPDGDGDSFGDGSVEPTMVCVPPAGVAANDQDCDDTDAAISPSDPEVCDDATDNDCDGEADEDCSSACDDSPVPTVGEGLDLTIYTDRAEFEAALGYCPVLVNFDGLEEGPFPALQFESLGIEITGEDGQYVDADFGYPEEYMPVSSPNMYAPGPVADVSGAATDGGNTTTVRFLLPGLDTLVYAGTAAFGLTFIDADFPDLGEATMVFYSGGGGEIGRVPAVNGANGSQEFRGAIATDAFGNPYSAIFSVVITNGSGWPGVSAGEGVVMDDFLFARPNRMPE